MQAVKFFKKNLLILLILIFSLPVYAGTLYKTNVVASYYAEAFHGKKTSNGETFNMNALTCAHKSLPFNTVIKVTNLKNGKTVNVRVNDRGPFVIGREIDLSKAAAIKLGMIGSGTTKVKLEIEKMGPNTKASQQTAAKAQKMMNALIASKGGSKTTKTTSAVKAKTDSSKLQPGTKWNIQTGAFSSKDNANKQAQKILKAGIKNVVFQTVKSTGVVRVVIKEVPAEQVHDIETKLQKISITDYTVKLVK